MKEGNHLDPLHRVLYADFYTVAGNSGVGYGACCFKALSKHVWWFFHLSAGLFIMRAMSVCCLRLSSNGKLHFLSFGKRSVRVNAKCTCCFIQTCPTIVMSSWLRCVSVIKPFIELLPRDWNVLGVCPSLASLVTRRLTVTRVLAVMVGIPAAQVRLRGSALFVS